MPVSSFPAARLLPALLALALAGCAAMPDLGTGEPDTIADAPYPALVPLEPLLAARPSARVDTETAGSDLAARRDRLQRRARQLNTGVIDPQTEARMRAGVKQ